MPTYDYECKHCRLNFVGRHSIADSVRLRCPNYESRRVTKRPPLVFLNLSAAIAPKDVPATASTTNARTSPEPRGAINLENATGVSISNVTIHGADIVLSSSNVSGLRVSGLTGHNANVGARFRQTDGDVSNVRFYNVRTAWEQDAASKIRSTDVVGVANTRASDSPGEE